MEIKTSKGTQEKMQEALGFSAMGRKGLDVLSPDDYESENDYLNAVATYDMQQNNPEFAAARRRAEREYSERKRKQAEAEMAAAVEEARKKVVLSDADKENAEKRARDRAQRDLAMGRINYSQMGETLDKYCAEEIAHTQKDRMNNAAINSILRSSSTRVKISSSVTAGAGKPMRRIGG